MPQPSDAATRPTGVLAQAGEILRPLKPAALGTLFAIYSDDSQTQQEIAEAIGSGRSTVSKYLQTQESLGLTEQQTQRYTITSRGEFVLSLLGGMIDRLDGDLSAVDWNADADTKELATVLAPLSGSRKIAIESYFVLHSIYSRSGVAGLLGTPQPVSLEDIVSDVAARNTDEKSTDIGLVRGKLRRFEDTGAIHRDDRRATLTEKGTEHGRVVDELAQFLGTEDKTGMNGCESPTKDESSESPGATDSDTDFTVSNDLSQHRPNSGNIAQQIQSHGFLGGGQTAVTGKSTTDSPDQLTVVPTYCLRPAANGPTNGDASSQQETLSVLPFTTMTAEELLDRASQIVKEHSEDVQLEPYWMIQIGTRLYPLGPTDEQPPDSL
jgi:biotin operon repressor